MQLLSHLCVAASHWPTAIHCRHQATRHWPLTRFRGHFLSSMKCLWHIGCMGSHHTAVVHAAPPATPAADADEAEPSSCPRDCCVRC